MIKIIPKNKKLLKSSKVRAWFKEVEAIIEKKLNDPASWDDDDRRIYEAVYLEQAMKIYLRNERMKGNFYVNRNRQI